jgi:hypothetical protein
MSVVNDYRQTWLWMHRPFSQPPLGAFLVFGSMLAAAVALVGTAVALVGLGIGL